MGPFVTRDTRRTGVGGGVGGGSDGPSQGSSRQQNHFRRLCSDQRGPTVELRIKWNSAEGKEDFVS